MRPLRAVLLCAVLAAPRAASAWTEAQPTDARLAAAVDASGGLVGVYRVTIHIDAGRFHGFELDGLPEGFLVDPLTTRAHDARGRAIAVKTEHWRSGRLHVALDQPRGERRGRVVFEIGFRAQAAVVDEESQARVEVSTPPWDHGMDRTVVSLEVDAPPDEVEVVDADLYDDLQVEEVGGATRITALRHRLPRWTPMVLRVRVPRPRMAAALDAAPPPPRRPRPVIRRPRPPSPPRETHWIAWAVAFAPLILAAVKVLESRRSARRAGCLVEPVVARRMGAGPRVFLLSLLCAGAGAATTKGHLTLAVLLLLLAGLVGAVRFARAKEETPGAGRWLRIEPAELRATVRRGRALRRSFRLLDPTSWTGFLLGASLVTAAAFAVHDATARGLDVAWTLGATLAAVLLVPLLTATGVTIPPPRACREARRLRRLIPALEGILGGEGGGGVGPIARIPEGADLPDMVRLRIGPAAAPGGLRCLEVGIEHLGEHAWTAMLVRTAPGSPAEAFLLHERRSMRIVRSPASDETVGILRTGFPSDRRLLAELRRFLSALRAAALAKDAARVESADAPGPRDLSTPG